MNRDEFISKKIMANFDVDHKYMKELIKKSIRADKKRGDYDCVHLQVMAMEELAELQQEISKCIRWDNRGTVGLEEEIADVIIMLQYLQMIHQISDIDIKMAVNVKLERLERHLLEKGYYK